MKKTLVTLMLGAGVAMAGESAPVVPAPTIAQPEAESVCSGLNFSISGGYASTQAEETSSMLPGSTLVPRILYGGQMSVTKDIGKTFEMHPLGIPVIPAQETCFNVGFTFGCYAGEESIALGSDALKTDVKAFPIELTCGVVHHITDNYHFYYGARVGAMVRQTKMNGQVDPTSFSDCDSTKVLPMAGVGAGFRYFIYDTLSIDFGYDLLFTFGEDCGKLVSDDGTTSFKKKYTSESARYYSTVHAGLNYEF